jgi:hypothetical protein
VDEYFLSIVRLEMICNALEAFVPVIAGIEELRTILHTSRRFPNPSVVFLEYNISSVFSEIVGRNVIS